MANHTTPSPGILSPDRRQPFSHALNTLSQLILLLSLIAPLTVLSSTRRWLFLPILVISSYLLFWTTSGDALVDIGLAPMVATHCVQSLHWVVLCDPRKTFKIKSSGKEGGDGGPGESVWSRIKWALYLLVSPRGINWTHESPFLPPRPSSTRRTRFILSKLFQALTCILIEGVAYIMNVTNPALTDPASSIYDYSFYYRALGVLSFSAAAYARINAGHCLLAALCVALGVSDAADWPDLFGSVKDAWCVGQFWSRTWHHLLRHTLTQITNALLPPLPPHRKNTSNYNGVMYTFSRLIFTFFISALIHASTDAMIVGHVVSGSWRFFLFQPFGIAFERVAFWCFGVSPSSTSKAGGKGKESMQSGPRAIVKIIGFAWVALWFSLTLPVMLDPFAKTGLFVHRKGNMNAGAVVIDWLVGRGLVEL